MDLMQYTPEAEITNRIRSIQKALEPTDLHGLLVVHHTNLFYFSGTSQNAYLFIPRSGKPLLMVKKSFERAQKESVIKDIVKLNSLKEIPMIISEYHHAGWDNIGMELDVIPYNTYRFYQDKIFDRQRLTDASGMLRNIRTLKSPYEIELIRHSCKVLDSAFSKVPDWLVEGMREIELAARFEGHMRKNGYSGVCQVRAFNSDFLFGNLVSGVSGAESSYFDGPVNGTGLTPANNPHGAGWKKIQKNEPVYIDYTCVVNGYTADAERIFAIGSLDGQLVSAYEAALKIQTKVIETLSEGRTCAQAWYASVALADEEGLLDHYMGMGKDRVKFVGHGVGLELDEMPILAKGFDFPVEKGMTFALEPKFVFPHGAVGIENTFAVTSTGIEKLTRYGEEIHYV